MRPASSTAVGGRGARTEEQEVVPAHHRSRKVRFSNEMREPQGEPDGIPIFAFVMAYSVFVPLAALSVGSSLQLAGLEGGMAKGMLLVLVGAATLAAAVGGFALLLQLRLDDIPRRLAALVLGIPVGGVLGFLAAWVAGVYLIGVGERVAETYGVGYLEGQGMSSREVLERLPAYMERGEWGGLLFSLLLVGVIGGMILALSVRSFYRR